MNFLCLSTSLIPQTVLMVGLFHLEVMLAKKRKRRYKLLRKSLPLPVWSRWVAVYDSVDGRDFEIIVGISKDGFNLLLDRFRSYCGSNGHYKPLIGVRGVLGCLLLYIKGTHTINELAEYFGASPSAVSRYLRMYMDLLLQTFQEMPQSRIEWPSLEKIDYHNRRIMARFPTLVGSFAFVDGLELSVYNNCDPDLQNSDYNGWKALVKSHQVLCFDTEGIIIFACLNRPGSWHDSEVSGAFYDQLMLTPLPYNVLADSGFPRLSRTYGRIKTPFKQTDVDQFVDLQERLQCIEESSIVTSARQPAEWGMAALHKTCRRLELRLPSGDHVKREKILACCCHFANFKIRTTGINQILTYYDHPDIPSLSNSEFMTRNRHYTRLVA